MIGGRPGAFKTALLWTLALNAAESGARVLFVSLEMTPGELALAALARFSGLERNRIALAFAPDPMKFADHEQRSWDEAVAHYASLESRLRVHGAEEHGRDVRNVIQSATRVSFDAVFVDHLGMVGRDSGGNELEVLGQAIHRLRGLSRGEERSGYRPWVVATSQLNREIDKGEERAPRLADFRGSARIEHDSDVAIGLMKRRGEEDAKVLQVDAFVLKNRFGPAPAIVMLEANGPTGLVTERRREDELPPEPHYTDREPGSDG